MEKKRKKREKKYEGMTKKDREKPFNLQWLRRKKKKTKAEARRIRIFDRKKERIPSFKKKCKECGEPIPSPLDFCSSRCKEEYEKKYGKEELTDKKIRELLKRILKEENI